MVRPWCTLSVMGEVTQILQRITSSDAAAADELLPLIYRELRSLAARKISQENPGQTLEATALVHEAYLRLVGHQADHNWQSRGHFYASAAEAMRRILIESARRRSRLKRGGGRVQQEVVEDQLPVELPLQPHDLMALNEALDLLEQHDPQAAQVVKLRFFAGLSIGQTAAAMDVSGKTVQREWTYARAWLGRALGESD